MEEENGIQRAKRRLEEQRSGTSVTLDPGVGNNVTQGLDSSKNPPSFDTIDPVAFRQGFLEQMSASHRATDAIYSRSHTELDKRRLEAQKKSTTEFTQMLDEWQKQVVTVKDPHQRKAMEEALRGCRRGLFFANAAEINHASEMLQEHEMNQKSAEDARTLFGTKVPIAEMDWDHFTNIQDVSNIANNRFFIRYGMRDYSPSVDKVEQGQRLATEVLAHITKPGEVSEILERSEYGDHPLSEAIREVMERRTAGNLKRQEIHELCSDEIDTFKLSKQLELDVAAIGRKLQQQELVVPQKKNPVNRLLDALWGKPSIQESAQTQETSPAKPEIKKAEPILAKEIPDEPEL